MSDDDVAIYNLIDVDSGLIVYVGQTKHPGERLRAHLKQATNWEMRRYFATHRIAMELVRVVSSEDAAAAERAAMHAALDAGSPLLNTHRFGWVAKDDRQLMLFSL